MVVFFTLLYCRCLHTFANPTTTTSARFDGNGTRLLCRDKYRPPIVYNVPKTDEQVNSTGLVQLTAQGYSPSPCGIHSCCFAGDDDEFVVASLTGHGLHIWSVPDSSGNRLIDQSLHSLRGHHREISSVQYCKTIQFFVVFCWWRSHY